MKKEQPTRYDIKRMLRDESGQTLAEYALMLVLIALSVSAAFPPVVTAISSVFTDVQTLLS